MNSRIFWIVFSCIFAGFWANDINTKQKNAFHREIAQNTVLAKQGNIDAIIHLAEVYRHGKGTLFDSHFGRNLYNSGYWYNQGALKGDKYAQLEIAKIYENGIAIEKNLQNANYWYYQSAMQGVNESQINLAKNFENGIGVGKSYNDAMYWYLQSAKQGDKEAIYKVGVVYDDGLFGFNEDNEQALLWLSKLDPNDKNSPFDLRRRLLVLKIPFPELNQRQTQVQNQQMPQNPTQYQSSKSYSSHHYGYSSECVTLCNDGTCSKSLGRRGVCSHHGGIKQF